MRQLLCAGLLCLVSTASWPDGIDSALEAVLELSSKLNPAPICTEAEHWQIYLQVGDVDEVILSEISVDVDGEEGLRRIYTPAEARALQGLGADLLGCFPVTAEARIARVHFAAARAGDAAREVSTRELEIVLDPGKAPRQLVLEMRPPAIRFGRMRLVPGWRATEMSALPGDARLQFVRYLVDTDRPLLAIARAEALLAGDLAEAASAQWVLAEALAAYGLRGRAREHFRRGAGAYDAERRTQSLLSLAMAEYLDGNHGAARDTLVLIDLPVRSLLDVRRRNLLSLTHFAQRDDAAALAALEQEDGLWLYTPYMRHNVGAALLRGGDKGQGVLVLERLGQIFPETRAEHALRDRANVELGEYFLAQRLGGTAKPYFHAVRLNSPYASRALLGLGWSEVSPLGETRERPALERRYDDRAPLSDSAPASLRQRFGYYEADISSSMEMRRHRRLDVESSAEAALLRALVPWLQLDALDGDDFATLEARLAIAYVHEQVGDPRQALVRYRRVMAMIDALEAELDALGASIDSGRFWQSVMAGGGIAEGMPTPTWLANWLAGHAFAGRREKSARLTALAVQVSEWGRTHVVSANEVERARNALISAAEAEAEAAQKATRSYLLAQREQLDIYRLAGLQAMAALQDRQLRNAP
jgi:hypothetical protein